ncbi:MAG: recombination mediator RecR [Bacteroidales bacterium]|nr:recombination mediator RecR [Bacteroidales bacterium]
MNTFSSKLLEDAVNQFAKLPGVGKKTAIRYVLHILKEDNVQVMDFGNTIMRLREEIKFCKNCHNISDNEICEICSTNSRDKSLVCVVEDIRDVIAIENTNQYNGIYHVLGGVISPMDGVGPSDLNISTLIDKVRNREIKEIVLALKTTIEGDTTCFYIFKKLKEYELNVSTIARGIAIGDELEYTDEITLGKSIINRVPYSGVHA